MTQILFKCPNCGNYCTPNLTSTMHYFTCVCGFDSRNIKVEYTNNTKSIIINSNQKEIKRYGENNERL